LAAYKMLSQQNCWNWLLYQRDIFLTKKTVRRVLIALPHLHGSEVLWHEVRMVNMGLRDMEPINSSLVRWCSWLLSIFYNDCVCDIWGYLRVPPWYQKSGNFTPLSNDAPLTWHCPTLLKFDAEGIQFIANGGSFNCSVRFFQFGTWPAWAVWWWIQHHKKVK
jgi:hypothetical protein